MISLYLAANSVKPCEMTMAPLNIAVAPSMLSLSNSLAS